MNKYSNSVNSAANQTFHLLTNLLEWSRSQRNKIQFKPETINLNEIISRVIALYSFAQRNQINFHPILQLQINKSTYRTKFTFFDSS
jgi:signal transduction histidine kinase